LSTNHNTSRPTRILVTGAAGFIGSNLVHWLLRQWPDANIVALDALTYAGNLANLEDLREHDRFRFIRGNICDRDLITELLSDGVQAVINVAAHTHVDRSLLGQDDFAGTNVGGVQVICEVIRQMGGIRLLQVSTDEVYGSMNPGETADESHAINPRNPYSATKAGGDLVVSAFRQSFDIDTVITRCCNNYGPLQYPEKVVPLFITHLFEDTQVPLYGDGLNVREWLHVDDHCAAIARVLEAGRSGEIYNVTSSNGLTNLDLTESLIDIVGKDKSLIKYVEDRPGHDRCYALNDSKIRTELGWSESYDFRDGLRETVQWYRDNESWWRPIKSGEYLKYYEQQYGERVKS
jgi:dTDP-glucose 4,6-dehydratase